jgi:hypothetical protein
VIARERTDESRSRAHEFVTEAKEAIADQVKMKMLAWQKFSVPKKKEEEEGNPTERKLNWNSGPARYTSNIPNGVPPRRAGCAETTAVEQTSDPAETYAYWSNKREVIAGGMPVPDLPFRELHKNVTTEKSAEDGFARGKLGPHIGSAEVKPAFGEQINNLRSKERADQGSAVNENETTILARPTFPEQEADGDAREHEPRVRRDGHGELCAIAPSGAERTSAKPE